jgi:hypothetical protein
MAYLLGAVGIRVGHEAHRDGPAEGLQLSVALHAFWTRSAVVRRPRVAMTFIESGCAAIAFLVRAVG